MRCGPSCPGKGAASDAGNAACLSLEICCEVVVDGYMDIAAVK